MSYTDSTTMEFPLGNGFVVKLNTSSEAFWLEYEYAETDVLTTGQITALKMMLNAAKGH